MPAIIFFAFVMSLMIGVVIVSILDDTLFESMAWKGKNRFVVRQIDNGEIREWICARYTVCDGKVSFRQDGHKDKTVVRGHWHVEPVPAS